MADLTSSGYVPLDQCAISYSNVLLLLSLVDTPVYMHVELTPVTILPICEGGGLPVLVPGALIAVDGPAALIAPAVPSALVPG